MVTITEARRIVQRQQRQVKQVEEEIKSRQEEAQRSEQRLKEAEKQISSKRVIRGLTRAGQVARNQAIGEIGERKSQIKEALSSLGLSSQKLEKAKSQVSKTDKVLSDMEKREKFLIERAKTAAKSQEIRETLAREGGKELEERLGQLQSIDIGKLELPSTDLVISEASMGQKFESFFARRGLQSPLAGLQDISETAANLATFDVKETPVKIIDIPSPTPRGGTTPTRPVDIRDVDTGILPPKQNLNIKTTDILSRFQAGNLSEEIALNQLKTAQKKFILDESKRTAGLRFAEGVGIGALSVIAPPVGVTLIGLTGADAVSRRKEILELAKSNPKAAAIQFGAGVVGGFVGAGGVSGVKLTSTTIKQPTLTLVGKSRTKFIKNVTKTLEPEFEVLVRQKKITGTRAFEIDIPSVKGDVKLRILEFTKDGQRRFIGQEIINGKPVESGVGGITFTKGKDGLTKMITRSVRFNTKKGISNLQFAEFLERATLKVQKQKGLKSVALTESTTKLAKKFDLKNLSPNQVREILRRPLFGSKEAIRRANKPFSRSEFNLANKLSKSKVVISSKIVKGRATRLKNTVSQVLKEKDVVNIRAVERGRGVVDLFLDTGKITTKKIKGKIAKRIVKGEAVDFTQIKIKKVNGKSKIKNKIKDILEKPVSQVQKVKQLKTLQKQTQEIRPSPTGTFTKIAKIIQVERIKGAIKTATGQATATALASGVKSVQATKQQQRTISRLKAKITNADDTVTRSDVKLAEALALGGKLSQRQTQVLRQRLVQRTRSPVTEKVKLPRRKIPVRLPSGIRNTALVSALRKIGKDKGVDVIVGQKRGKTRVIAKNVPPFRGLKKGLKFVDRNIDASLRIKPTGKNTKKKDIKPFNRGKKFRLSRKDPLFVVEKRKFRLDFPEEKRQFKLEKKRKAPKSGGRKKKK